MNRFVAEQVEFSFKGACGNDCPFCRTHDAIIMDYPDYVCRDCGSTFRADHGKGVWALIRRNMRRR